MKIHKLSMLIHNAIGIPDEDMLKKNLIEQVMAAKDKGFTMIAIEGAVYSIQTVLDSKQSMTYILENMPLFKEEDILLDVERRAGPGEKFETIPEPEIIKFNKSFETLYAISMNMADQCIGAKTIENRIAKLDEEYNELSQAFEAFKSLVPTRVSENTKYYDPHEIRDVWNNIVGEAGDVLFVLLHILHTSGEATAFELLHKASSKMLARMNDVNYIAKN